MNTRNVFYLVVISLCLFLGACESSEIRNYTEHSSTTFYKDLPYGCDSAKVIYPDLILSADEYDETPTAMAFFYGEDNVVLTVSIGDNSYARVASKNAPLSNELLMKKTLTRSGGYYEFSVGETLLFELNSSGSLTRGYLECVDDISDQMCDGSMGTVSKLLCKTCSSCAVVAAAAICLFKYDVNPLGNITQVSPFSPIINIDGSYAEILAIINN